MTPLITPRLTGRQLCADDWPFFLQLYRDRQVMRFITDPLSEQSIREKFSSRLPLWQRSSKHWLCLLLSDRDSGEPVGLTGFCLQETGAEAGFIFSPQGQGKGYAAESLNCLAARFFSEGYGDRLCCQVTDGNEACQRLMQRCGFRLTERQSRSFYLAGQWHDDLHFVRYASDPKPEIPG
ncbi:GNAT family N-acetyltransferase [Tatumella sp. JGM118]|uniref:GNAT family N-acetyltransferase n=1 Tax=Tatumella sp. JGM118 TaxID=2799796 RepID=UPI001BAF668D|nr:GNAT family N-acetyltransferase [Tatumella sp. JGM118]MBS0911013.1 GNAT family N-acetyltransferase [Tatumella sp. JGM118]